MAAFRRFLALAIVCLSSFTAAQLSDEAAAARVLGPRWRQMSRSSGMIFSGTVLGTEAQPAREGRPLPLMLTKFRVGRAIVGVRTGEMVTVREWAGAWSMHRAMRSGEHLLIFLYPPSRLGLTSPVDGAAGQVMLNPRGEITAADALLLPEEPERGSTSGAGAPDQNSRLYAAVNRCATQNQSLSGNCKAPIQRQPKCSAEELPLSRGCTPVTQPNITFRELERAILNARRNSPMPPVRIKE